MLILCLTCENLGVHYQISLLCGFLWRNARQSHLQPDVTGLVTVHSKTLCMHKQGTEMITLLQNSCKPCEPPRCWAVPFGKLKFNGLTQKLPCQPVCQEFDCNETKHNLMGKISCSADNSSFTISYVMCTKDNSKVGHQGAQGRGP